MVQHRSEMVCAVAIFTLAVFPTGVKSHDLRTTTGKIDRDAAWKKAAELAAAMKELAKPKRQKVVTHGPAGDQFATQESLRLYWKEQAERELLAVNDTPPEPPRVRVKEMKPMTASVFLEGQAMQEKDVRNGTKSFLHRGAWKHSTHAKATPRFSEGDCVVAKLKGADFNGQHGQLATVLEEEDGDFLMVNIGGNWLNVPPENLEAGFCIGALVELQNLKAEALNGKFGTIMDFVSDKGRYLLQVEGPSKQISENLQARKSREIISLHGIKAENLQAIRRFANEDRVFARHLSKKSAWLNGKKGEVLSSLDEPGRYQIKFDERERPVSISQRNLKAEPKKRLPPKRAARAQAPLQNASSSKPETGGIATPAELAKRRKTEQQARLQGLCHEPKCDGDHPKANPPEGTLREFEFFLSECKVTQGKVLTTSEYMRALEPAQKERFMSFAKPEDAYLCKESCIFAFKGSAVGAVGNGRMDFVRIKDDTDEPRCDHFNALVKKDKKEEAKRNKVPSCGACCSAKCNGWHKNPDGTQFTLSDCEITEGKMMMDGQAIPPSKYSRGPDSDPPGLNKGEYLCKESCKFPFFPKYHIMFIEEYGEERLGRMNFVRTGGIDVSKHSCDILEEDM